MRQALMFILIVVNFPAYPDSSSGEQIHAAESYTVVVKPNPYVKIYPLVSQLIAVATTAGLVHLTPKPMLVEAKLALGTITYISTLTLLYITGINGNHGLDSEDYEEYRNRFAAHFSEVRRLLDRLPYFLRSSLQIHTNPEELEGVGELTDRLRRLEAESSATPTLATFLRSPEGRVWLSDLSRLASDLYSTVKFANFIPSPGFGPSRSVKKAVRTLLACEQALLGLQAVYVTSD